MKKGDYDRVDEYVRKFGGAGNFFGKVFDAFDFSFAIIRVSDFEIEVCNCDLVLSELGRKKIGEVVELKRDVVFEVEGHRVYLCPIFGGGEVVSVIYYELPRVKENSSDEIFYKILQNSQDVVYRYDFLEKRFVYVSESVYTLFGFGLSEFVKFSWEDFLKRVHPDDVAGICECLENECSCVREYRWKCKDGKYRWVLDKRTLVMGEDGEIISVIGDIRDVGFDKKIVEEKEKLEARIAYMRRREVEGKVDLTGKEKIVLWGICRYPLLSDAELAEKLELKRSTLTAIKNRLKKANWFKLVYVPNFNKLGCDYAGFFRGALSKKSKGFDLDFVRDSKNVVLKSFQDDKLFGFYVSKKIVEFRKFVADFVSKSEGVDFVSEDFFYSLDNFELRDCSSFVNFIFSLGKEKDFVRFNFKNSLADLNVNERRVLHAIVTEPDLTSAEVAKKIWISNPTVIKIRNRLVEDGIVYPYVVVDFRKLGFGFLGKLDFSFDSDVVSNPMNGDFDSRVLFRIKGKGKYVDFVLFRSEREAEEEVEMIREAYRKKGVYMDFNWEVFPIQKRGKNMLDFDGFVEDLLFDGV